jgi:uncharacterized membrane protein
MIIAGLALVGTFVSIYLALYKLGYIGEMVCGVGSCSTVQLSPWANFVGVPVAVWGVGWYLVVLALALAGTGERWADAPGLSLALVALSAWGFAFSAWLTYLEARVINAWCQWCVVSAIIVTFILILSVLDWREVARERDAELADEPG